jgi:ribosomal protein S18 acetylase RimI-like enzyme
MSIVQAQESHVQTVCEWLLAEHLDTSGGLYDNAHMLPEAQSAGKLHCFVSLDEVLGFVMLHPMLESASISLLEVRPGHRRRGIGRQLANFAMGRLFAEGAKYIKVQCSPLQSEHFWRSMGFDTDVNREQGHWSAPMLYLEAPEKQTIGLVNAS